MRLTRWRGAALGALAAAWAAWFAVAWGEPTRPAQRAAEGDTPKADTPMADAKKPEAKKADGKKPASTGKNDKGLPGFTREREAAALLFVRTHHPELADLLDQLKKHDKFEYQQAIRDLFRQSERLAQIQERNPHKYELELEAWKLNSRIQVLVARLSMASDPAVERQLREAMAGYLDLREQVLVEDRARVTARVAEIDAELSELQQDREAQVQKQMDRLLGGVKKGKEKKKEG